MKNKKDNFFSNKGNLDFYTLSEEEKSALWDKIDKSMQQKRRRRFYKLTSVAATFLLFLGFIFYLSQSNQPKSIDVDIKKIAKNARAAIDTGNHISIVEISKNQTDSLSIANVQSMEDSVLHLSSQASSSPTDEHFSSVYVPYGKRLEVKLSEGTKVWLNAGSQLTFPKTFSSTERVVYLAGEGYFDVAHSKTPFKVLTDQNRVEVLGTTFNLSSYPEDGMDVVELLTGSISFQSQDKLFNPIILKPSEELAMNLETKHIQIKKGSLGNSILWTKKQLMLDNTPLPLLFRKLERVYNVRINDGHLSGLSSVLYSGRLDMSSDLHSVLETIYELRFYDIKIKEKEVYVIEK